MTREQTWFGQADYDCRLEWGQRGAHAAALRGDILVVVDVLSFSTAVVAAVENGAQIYPCGKDEDASAIAGRWGAVMAVHREEVPGKGQYSLSPETFKSALPGERIVLRSPNGASCSRYGSHAPLLFVGALVNAAAVASAVAQAVAELKASVTILACGERWHTRHEDEGLRFAAEDYLGAGAVLAHLPGYLTRSPEAVLSQAAFTALAGHLTETLRGCGSGIELIDKGYSRDVEQTARLNCSAVVPVLHQGLYLTEERLTK